MPGDGLVLTTGNEFADSRNLYMQVCGNGEKIKREMCVCVCGWVCVCACICTLTYVRTYVHCVNMSHSTYSIRS